MAFTAIYVRLLLRHLLAVYYINAFRKTVPVVWQASSVDGEHTLLCSVCVGWSLYCGRILGYHHLAFHHLAVVHHAMFRCIEFCASRLRDVATYQRERCKVANGSSLRAFGCYCGMVDCQVFACTAVSRYAVHAAFGVYGAVVYGKVGFNGIESAVAQALCVECAAPRDDQSFPESDGSFLCFQVIDANEPYCQPLDFGISVFTQYYVIFCKFSSFILHCQVFSNIFLLFVNYSFKRWSDVSFLPALRYMFLIRTWWIAPLRLRTGILRIADMLLSSIVQYA